MSHRPPVRNRHQSSRHAPRAVCFSLAIALVSLIGCSNSDPQLIIQSAKRQQSFSQSFAIAYSAENRGGDTDVVLIDDSTKQSLNGVHTDSPVREVMHIRVLWKPTRDMTSDHTSSFNATLHWYVMGPHPEDILEYAGTAMVVVEPSSQGLNLSVRNASLRPSARRGELLDPIGSATLHGVVHTTSSSQRVRQVLTQIRQAVAAARNVPANVAVGAASESPSSAQ